MREQWEVEPTVSLPAREAGEPGAAPARFVSTMSHETPLAEMACQGPFGGHGVTTFTLRPAPVEAGSSGFWGTTLTAASSFTGGLRADADPTAWWPR